MHVFSGISIQHTVSTLCNSLHTHIYSIIQYNARPNIYTSWSVSRKEDAVYYVFLTEKSTLNSRALHQASKLKIKKNKSFVSCLNSVTSEGTEECVRGSCVCISRASLLLMVNFAPIPCRMPWIPTDNNSCQEWC